MKKIASSLLVTALLIAASPAFAQRGGGHHGHPHPHRGNKVVVVKRSSFRPHKVVVYHPVWGPKFAFYHRWVYWPGYNFYWDNWRNSYFFWNGAMWVAASSPPPTVVNINIQNEKHYEMKEAEDDIDDVYKSNDAHQKEYKKD